MSLRSVKTVVLDEALKRDLKKEKMGEKLLNSLKKEGKKEKKEHDSTEYRKYLRDVLAHKERRLNWQQDVARRNDEERRRKAAEGDRPSYQAHSKSDTDPKAVQKTIENVGALGSHLLKKAAIHGVKKLVDRRNRKKAERAEKGKEAIKANLDSKMKQKLLPPAPAQKSGREKRTELAQRKMWKSGTGFTEEYCCWREEFIYELSEIRKGKKPKIDDDKIIDVMKGKNKITINPRINERYAYIEMYLSSLNETTNNSIAMSRATHPITGVQIDKTNGKRKQPGKYSSEFVKDKIEKMFTGDSHYYFNSNLTNPKVDDGEVSGVQYNSGDGPMNANESYTPEDGFRQHSQERFTAGSGDETRKRRTSNVLKLMAKMNPEPLPKKKGKKKKKINEAVKKEKIANALLGVAFSASALQSPKDFVRTGHIESPGVALMQRWARRRGEAERNLDNGRVSHPSRNKKKVNEEIKLSKKQLLALIIKKLSDEKKRKNYLLNYGYIGEAKYDKSNLQCNKPKADPVGDSTTGKSHVVKACTGGTEKLIRFGQRGVKGSPKKEGESEAYAKRRERFKARHAKNIAKGKISAAYWADRVKW